MELEEHNLNSHADVLEEGMTRPPGMESLHIPLPLNLECQDI